MGDNLHWGILGSAKIAREKVGPALNIPGVSKVEAVASRSLENARVFGELLDTTKSYPSYEQLLEDPAVEAVYIPLPNDLHCEWSIKAAEAGKHVLCEKPLAVNTSEIERLITASEENSVLIKEAFMIRTHPLWLEVKEKVNSGKIGELKSIVSVFSYFNDDPQNIRNKKEHGGGALFDIGCYCINVSRWFFDSEPISVQSTIDWSEAFETDQMTSALMQFKEGHSIFTCSTKLIPHQRVELLGTQGRIEIPIPFNIPRFEPTLYVQDLEGKRGNRSVERFEIDPRDQYVTQTLDFVDAIESKDYSDSLRDSLKGMKVIEAVFSAAK